MTKKTLGRRDFLKQAVLTGAAVGMAGAASNGTPNQAQAQNTATAGAIPKRKLGNTGIQVPILMQGTAQSMNQKYDRLLHLLYREGVTGIDTALSYGWGSSHKAVKNFITQVGGRDSLWLTSKSGAGSPSRFMAAADEAREELGVDNIDLFLMHGIDDLEMLRPEMLAAGEKLRKSGKIKFFGFSCHDDDVVALMNRAAKVGGIDAILFRYNFRRYGDKELNLAMDACKKAGIGLLAMKTYGGVSSSEEKVVRFKSSNFTLGQAKLKSVWADDRIDTIVSEMDSMSVARENISAARSPLALNADEMHQLNRLAALTAHLACQGCASHCQAAAGAPVAIADTLRFFSYHEAYGDTPRARRLYGALSPEQKNWRGVDLAAAGAACPQGINIAQRISQADKVLAG